MHNLYILYLFPSAGILFKTNRPLLSDLFHSFRSLFLILLFLYSLLSGVPLHALRDRLIVFSDVVQQPVQAILDGLVDLLTIAQDR